MRWYRISHNGSDAFGYADGNYIRLTDASSFDAVLAGDFKALEKEVSPETAQILAPFTPGKIIAVGLNYADHCREAGFETPKSPVIFAKYLNTVAAAGQGLSWPKGTTNKVDFEAELGVVVGRQLKGVDEATAQAAIFGYVVVNDISARDIQSDDGQWVRGKSLDGFCPFGPALVTSDEVPDPQNLGIKCLVNGKTYQDSNTDQMIFSCAYLVSFLSRTMTLEPGDLILTGTPHGVGNFYDPPVYLQPGDEVSVIIEGLGTLTNPVVGPV